MLGLGTVAAQSEEAPLCVATVQEERFTEAEGPNGITAPPMVNNIRHTTESFAIDEDAFEAVSLEGRRIVVRASWPNPANNLGLRLMQIGFGGQTQMGYAFEDGGQLELTAVHGDEHVGPAPGVNEDGDVRNEVRIEPELEYELDIFCQPVPMADFEFDVEVAAIERGC